MDNDKLNKGIKDIKNLKLTESEKSKMLSVISAHIDNSSSVLQTNMQRKNFWSEYNWSVFLKTAPSLAFVLLVLVGGSAFVVSSEKSIPGDTLYSVKMNIDEPIQDTVSSFNPVSKIQWEAEKTNRRLDEVQTLSAQGKLSTTTRGEAEVKIQASAQKISDIVDEGSTTEDTKTKENKTKAEEFFQATITQHSENLDKIKSTLSEEGKNQINLFQKAILKALNRRVSSKNKQATSTIEKTETEREISTTTATTTKDGENDDHESK